jgi:hypothetical protein
MQEDIAPLTPAIVISSQQSIMTTRLPDKRIIATMQSLCDALQIARASQVRRIRSHRLLSKQLLLVPIATNSGWQQMDVLVSWAIPIWLSNIHLTRLAPEKQQLVLAFQETIVDDLHRYFAELDAREAAGQPSEPEIAPGDWVEAEPMSSLPDTIWERQYEVMVGFERKWQMMERDIATMKTELAEIRQQLRGASAAGQTQRDNRPLSLEHIMQLYTLARALESQTGEPVSALFRQLAEVFDVTDVSAIPDAGWEHVLHWFWQHANAN